MSETSVDYVRVFAGADGQWFYESKANNGQVLSVSEGYGRRGDAIDAARTEYPDVDLVVRGEEGR